MDIKKLTKIDDGFNKFEESYPINLMKYAYKKFGVSIKPLGASLYSIKSVKTKNLLSQIDKNLTINKQEINFATKKDKNKLKKYLFFKKTISY